MTWPLLAGAILFEVGATLSLKPASDGRRGWYGPVVLGYLLAFTCLSGALRLGLPLGVGYGIWTACGVALAALGSRLLFGEPLTRTMLVGIALIATGVLFIESA